jgi:hypothetical protein
MHAVVYNVMQTFAPVAREKREDFVLKAL